MLLPNVPMKKIVNESLTDSLSLTLGWKKKMHRFWNGILKASGPWKTENLGIILKCFVGKDVGVVKTKLF